MADNIILDESLPSDSLQLQLFGETQRGIKAATNDVRAVTGVTLADGIADYDPVYYDSGDAEWKLASNGTAFYGLADATLGGVVVLGVVENSSWSWTPGSTVYVQADSTLSHVETAVAAGSAVTATQLLLDSRLGDALTELSSLQLEVSAARAGEVDLDTRLDSLDTLVAGKKDDFTENDAFNKNFGTAADTVCEGNDSRLSDNRTPTNHANEAHSQNFITATGVTFENLDTNGDVGASSNQVARGDHTHGAGGTTYASDTAFVPGSTTLTATDVQTALEEIMGRYVATEQDTNMGIIAYWQDYGGF